MKKLFMWSALLMTGFAFYSCDDVVDNPVKDTNAEWNYSVSVTCPGFDFKGLADPETGDAFTYEVPKTLYVLNEEGQEIGTISTPTAPAVNTAATYSGTLKGALGGQKLIITTKVGSDLAKQDGTVKSAVENGIYQADTVAIKIYNANSQKVTTAAAKLKNSTAIVGTYHWDLRAEDKVQVTANNLSFEWTINKKYDPSVNSTFYLAIPTSGDQEEKITITNNGLDGITRVATITKENFPLPLNAGEYKWTQYIPFENTGVDLTVWDAKYRADGGTGVRTLWAYINKDKSYTITQSGKEALDSVDIYVYGNKDDNVAVTINNIRLGKERYFGVYDGAKVAITLIGENKFETLTLNTPLTKNGDGTWAFEQLNIGGNAYWDGSKYVVDYAAEYTINEDLNLKHLSSSNGAKLTIADGKKVSVINEKGTAVSVYRATFNIGKGATLTAESKSKGSTVINIESADFNVGESATVLAQGYKDGNAMYLYNYNDNANNQKLNINIGKNATVTLIGGPKEVLGRGMYIYNYYNATTNITLDEGATLNATGIDRQGIYCYSRNYNSDYNDNSSVNFKIAKGAKITAEDTVDGQGFYGAVSGGKINFDGEGTFEAKSNGSYGMILYNSNNFFFNSGSIIAIGGKANPAVYGNNFTIGEKITSFKAQKGAEATQYISNWGSEALLENLVADKTKFEDKTDATAGTRTITPKPATTE